MKWELSIYCHSYVDIDNFVGPGSIIMHYFLILFLFFIYLKIKIS
jgi:hypothetical protein